MCAVQQCVRVLSPQLSALLNMNTTSRIREIAGECWLSACCDTLQPHWLLMHGGHVAVS